MRDRYIITNEHTINKMKSMETAIIIIIIGAPSLIVIAAHCIIIIGMEMLRA